MFNLLLGAFWPRSVPLFNMVKPAEAPTLFSKSRRCTFLFSWIRPDYIQPVRGSSAPRHVSTDTGSPSAATECCIKPLGSTQSRTTQTRRVGLPREGQPLTFEIE